MPVGPGDRRSATGDVGLRYRAVQEKPRVRHAGAGCCDGDFRSARNACHAARRDLQARGELGLSRGLPLTAEGRRIDYRRTPYADTVVDGAFDDNFVALVRRSSAEIEGWWLVELSIGATDAPFIDWQERYQLPPALVSPDRH